MERKRLDSDRNIILTGPARSGTNLACKMLNQLENVVALQEAMNVGSLAKLENFEAMRISIDRFFDDMREAVVERGEFLTKNQNGQVLDNYFVGQIAGAEVRKNEAKLGFVRLDRAVDAGVLLVLKHPAAFTALLPRLVTIYPCYSMIRNPLWVLASWNSINLPHYHGRIPMAEAFSRTLSTALDAIPDRIDRQIYLLSWMFEQISSLERYRIIYYEELIATSGKALKVITPKAEALEESLRNENRYERYPNVPVEELKSRLIKTGGSFFDFYSPSDLA
jgi:hypothetical protein